MLSNHLKCHSILLSQNLQGQVQDKVLVFSHKLFDPLSYEVSVNISLKYQCGCKVGTSNFNIKQLHTKVCLHSMDQLHSKSHCMKTSKTPSRLNFESSFKKYSPSLNLVFHLSVKLVKWRHHRRK